MSQTLSQMATDVLRDAQIPENSSASSVQALADAKSYLNDGGEDVHSRRQWREYIIRGTYAVPASTRIIALSSITVASGFPSAANGFNPSFAEIAEIYDSSGNPLLPVDPGSTNMAQADIWTSTQSPDQYINLGKNGIYLLGTYSAAETLSFVGKAAWQDLTSSESCIMGTLAESAMKSYAVASLFQYHERDDQRAATEWQKFQGWITKLLDAAEVQGGNVKQVMPLAPWTGQSPIGQFSTSPTGAGLSYGDY